MEPSSLAVGSDARVGEPHRPRPGRLLGDVIVELGYAERDIIERAVVEGRRLGRHLGQVLVEQHAITPDQLAIAMAERLGLEHISLDCFQVDLSCAALITPAVARRLQAVPVAYLDPETVLVAMLNPSDIIALDDLAMITELRLKPAVVSPGDFEALVARMSRADGSLLEEEEIGHEETEEDDLTAIAESAEDAPIVKLVRSIIVQAVEQGASDVHFDPLSGGEVQIRYRIDGVMSDATRIPRRMAAKVISRVKILASLDIAERRLPQDGRVRMTLDQRKIDFRVAVSPLVLGEAIVMRVLDAGRQALTLDDLGMGDEERSRFVRGLTRAHGGILATGPTGSGKSTSLYAAVELVRSPEKTLMTIEDPVEYQLDGVKQMQVNERIGLTFPTGLRSIVRADPDVIMVGEMRDRESAQIAVEAALTGHLVLSTLHTNNAASAPIRLIDMGIEPYLVASSIDCVVAQRLVRRLCESCRRAVDVPGRDLGLDTGSQVQVREAVGCHRCRDTGYKGRVGIYEVMTVSEEIRALIVRRAPASAIEAQAVAEGMRPLRADGLEKVRAGLTTLAELGRVTD